MGATRRQGDMERQGDHSSLHDPSHLARVPLSVILPIPVHSPSIDTESTSEHLCVHTFTEKVFISCRRQESIDFLLKYWSPILNNHPKLNVQVFPPCL